MKKKEKPHLQKHQTFDHSIWFIVVFIFYASFWLFFFVHKYFPTYNVVCSLFPYTNKPVHILYEPVEVEVFLIITWDSLCVFFYSFQFNHFRWIFFVVFSFFPLDFSIFMDFRWIFFWFVSCLHFMETLGNITVVYVCVCECVLGIITFIFFLLLNMAEILLIIIIFFCFFYFFSSLTYDRWLFYFFLYIFTFLFSCFLNLLTFISYVYLMYIFLIVFPSYNNRKVFNF